jgi:hypothetical protein
VPCGENYRNLLDCVDATPIWSKLLIPLEAGSTILECVLRTFWDCKLGSILSRQRKRKPTTVGDCNFCRHEIELFRVAKMYGTAGSLTSTYRVVRNTTLRAESEIKHRRMTMREFQLSKNLPRKQSGEQIDQATKSASWMPWCQ